jgi:hypothetical protein
MYEGWNATFISVCPRAARVIHGHLLHVYFIVVLAGLQTDIDRRNLETGVDRLQQ